MSMDYRFECLGGPLDGEMHFPNAGLAHLTVQLFGAWHEYVIAPTDFGQMLVYVGVGPVNKERHAA